jgi:glycosyltransferase involved in cell wall biosynthesis
LDGWEVVAIEGRVELEVAELLRTSQIFLAFGQREGFGLPALEALACGCLVVGYHGFGGREIFQSSFATAIEDGDCVAFAQAVENVIRLIDEEPEKMVALGAAAARYAHETYSQERERQDLLEVFAPLLSDGRV